MHSFNRFHASVSFHAAKQKYIRVRHEACSAASQTMTEFLGIPVQITEWSARANKGLEGWQGSRFPWAEIMRRHNDPGRLDMAIWSEDRLCGLGLGLATGQSVMLRFLEGDPRQGCPLKGRRILIALEAATNYAQARGKRELRVQPINDKLVNLYETVYGFNLVKPHKEAQYYRKEV